MPNDLMGKLLLFATIAFGVGACGGQQTAVAPAQVTVTVTAQTPTTSVSELSPTAVSSPPPSAQLFFSTADDFADYLEAHGYPCYGTEHLGTKQRSCADDFSITVWRDQETAVGQARENVDMLEQSGIITDFIVVGNGMIAPPDFRSEEMMDALAEDQPVHVE